MLKLNQFTIHSIRFPYNSITIYFYLSNYAFLFP